MLKIEIIIALCLLFSSHFFYLTAAKSRHREMTVEVTAGLEECYFLDEVTSGHNIDFEYQVTGSSSPTGTKDITVKIYSPAPSLTTIYENKMANEGSFNEEAKESGDYKICLDNTVATWSDKTVFFEVMVEDPEDDYDEDEYLDSNEMEALKANNEDTEDLFNMKIEEIKTFVHDIRKNIDKIRHFQSMQGAHMSKDTHQVDGNLNMINFWSVVHLLVMILVGLTQVFMVRQLFEEKSVFKNFTSAT